MANPVPGADERQYYLVDGRYLGLFPYGLGRSMESCVRGDGTQLGRSHGGRQADRQRTC